MSWKADYLRIQTPLPSESQILWHWHLISRFSLFSLRLDRPPTRPHTSSILPPASSCKNPTHPILQCLAPIPNPSGKLQPLTFSLLLTCPFYFLFKCSTWAFDTIFHNRLEFLPYLCIPKAHEQNSAELEDCWGHRPTMQKAHLEIHEKTWFQEDKDLKYNVLFYITWTLFYS